MSNRKLGNTFEDELCEILSGYGFWCTNLAQKKSGQPADVIAAKNKKAYLIDAKVCSDNTFDLRRMEENQDTAMELWDICGNGLGWFALKLTDGQIFFISHYVIKAYRNKQASLSTKDIYELGTPVEKWVKKCK